jgi:hypothetical protein
VNQILKLTYQTFCSGWRIKWTDSNNGMWTKDIRSIRLNEFFAIDRVIKTYGIREALHDNKYTLGGSNVRTTV